MNGRLAPTGLNDPLSRWVERPRRPEKRANAPAVTMARRQAIAEALSAERRQQIHDEAAEAATRIMREWEGRR